MKKPRLKLYGSNSFEGQYRARIVAANQAEAREHIGRCSRDDFANYWGEIDWKDEPKLAWMFNHRGVLFVAPVYDDGKWIKDPVYAPRIKDNDPLWSKFDVYVTTDGSDPPAPMTRRTHCLWKMTLEMKLPNGKVETSEAFMWKERPRVTCCFTMKKSK